MQVDLDLLENALSIRMRVLVDDLDGALESRVDVTTREHLTVGATTKYLARQRVHVRETRRLHVGREATLFFTRRCLITIRIRCVIISIQRVAAAAIRCITINVIANGICCWVVVFDRFIIIIRIYIYNVYANTGTFLF
jgi:hypothetical protein